MNKKNSKSRLLGFAAILTVVGLYTSNFIATRYSVQNGLSAYDLVALRFSISGILLFPFLYRLGFKDLGGIGWRRGIILTWLAGAPYIATFFGGLTFAPAAHGAVLNPGIVPSVVFVSMVILGLQQFSLRRAISLVMIIFGLVFVTASSFVAKGDVLLGDFLLFATGISWGIFTLLLKLWKIKPLQAAVVISVLSIFFLPLYFVFFYDGFSNATIVHIMAQGAFQGIGTSILGILCLTFAVQRLGAQLTSLFSPLIPVLTTVAAVPILGEIPSSLQWVGVIVVVLGMFNAARPTQLESMSAVSNHAAQPVGEDD